MINNYNLLKNIAFQNGISLFGVADVKAISTISTKLPSDFKYAISIGYKLSDGIIDSLVDKPTRIYLHHYRQVNLILDQTALILGSIISKAGYNFLPIPASQITNWKNLTGDFSHKEIGLYAGLGWIGKNNLLVNPKYGSRVRYVSIFTDFPLLVDKKIEENCGDCKKCISICPAKAIKEKIEEFELPKCQEQLVIFSKKENLGAQHICGLCLKACKGNGKD